MELCHKPYNPRIDEDSISPIKEDYDQTKDNPSTYFTRETGRMANKIYEYVYWNLRAEQDGVAFKCNYKNFEPFGTALPSDIPKRSIVNRNLTEVLGYPFKHTYYKDYKNEISSMLKFKQQENSRDVVIHLRLDDILNDCPHYTLIPFSFYIDLFKKLPIPENITIIGLAVDEFQHQYVDCLKLSLKELYRRKGHQVEIIKSIGNSIQEDFDIISSAKTLVASTSTFWYWSSFLSNTVEKVYYPEFGVCLQMCLDSDPKYEPFARALHPMKIKKENLHRIFL